MTDDEFLSAFQNRTLTAFHHVDHVRLTWLMVRRHGRASAMKITQQAICDFAAHHGQTAKYHQTLTEFWVSLIADHTARRPADDSFDAFIAAFPVLLDKSLPRRHWHEETLFSDPARLRWVDPDLEPMPGLSAEC